MTSKVPTWIGCFSVALMMLLSATLPVQFSEAKYKNKVTMDFVENCENSNCGNNGPLTQGDGTATALAPLQISTREQTPAGSPGPQGPVGVTADSLYIVEGEEAFSTVANTFSTSTADQTHQSIEGIDGESSASNSGGNSVNIN